MERHGIDEDAAFATLRRASNDLNIKLRDVAAQVAERPTDSDQHSAPRSGAGVDG